MDQFEPLFDWARDSGEKIIRLDLTIGLGVKQMDNWDRVLDSAARHNLLVLPILSNWADWKDDSLLRRGPTRDEWLAWAGSVVRRWKDRPEIFAWEIFSEVDLAPKATEAEAEDFVAEAAKVIRANDPLHRPVTASLALPKSWPAFYRPLDFVEAHVYADDPRYHGDLDGMILSRVHELAAYGKPVFLGECGLDSKVPVGTLDAQPTSAIGIRHAIWASLVSGAMNGRMLWWQDGYDQYSKVDVRTRYRDASAPVAQFIEGVDFAGLHPATISGEGLEGGVLARRDFALGWVRDSECRAPSWPVRKLEGRSISLDAPGRWSVMFYDPASGQPIAKGAANGGVKTQLALPPFSASIAFQMRRIAAPE